MTYEQFKELKIGDPVQVDFTYFKNYKVEKSKEIAQIVGLNEQSVGVKLPSGEIRVYHFRQLEEA